MYLVKRSGLTTLDANKMISSEASLVKQTSKAFPMSSLKSKPDLPISSHITTDLNLTAAYNDVPNADVNIEERPRFVLGGDRNATCALFDVVECEKENKHYDTSYLKRYLSCLILAMDWFSVSLVNQTWLNREGNNGLVITGAFVTAYVARFLDRLVSSGLTFLFVTQKYTPGLYIGDQYSYYCDSNGNVLGTSRGAPTNFWNDKSDPWGSTDYYKGYSIETYATFGPQRIVLMRPTDELIIPSDFVVVPDSTYHGRTELSPPKEPNSLCALVRVKTQDFIEPTSSTDEQLLEWDIRDSEYINTIAEEPEGFLEDLVSHPTQHIPLFTSVCTSILLYVVAYNGFIPYPFVALPATLFAIYQYYLWLHQPEGFRLVLNNYRIKFYGPNSEEAEAWYALNRVDPVTQLPFGWYHVTTRGIVQVRQGSSQANWTNVPRLVSALCGSRQAPSTSVCSHYQRLCRAVAPVMAYRGNFEVMEQMDPEIKVMMAAYDLTVNAPTEKGTIDLHLANDDKWREFVTALVTKTTILASATKRVARAGLRSVYPSSHHRDLVLNMWSAQRLPIIAPFEEAPDLSEYTGKKLRKYESAYVDKYLFDDEAGYTTFIKSEALPEANVRKKGNRVITMNKPAFNNRTMNWMKEFEHAVLSMKDPNTKHRLIAKGLNCDQRSEIILNLCHLFSNVASIDFKNCDGHFNGASYRGVIEAFVKLGFDPEAAESILRAKTYGAIEYQNPQQRSGDLFTGSGNCCLVSSMLYPFLSRDFTFFCDGDDTLLFYNKPELLEEVSESLMKLGFEISIDKEQETDVSPDSMMVIPFCQTFYTVHGYYVDLKRRINKLCNIVAPNSLVAARTILGKLQGLDVLSKLGVNLHIDVNPLIHGKDENQDVQHLEMMYAGLEHYHPETTEDLDLTDPNTGLIAKVIIAIRDDPLLKTLRFFGRKESTRYHKRVIHLIQNVVDEAVEFENDFVSRGTSDEHVDELMESSRVYLASLSATRRHV